MLVLTRYEGEVIVVDSDIRNTVLSIGRGKVRLGIAAPATVKVVREELFQPGVEEGTARILRETVPAES